MAQNKKRLTNNIEADFFEIKPQILSSGIKLNIVSFFEFIYAAAGVNKLLLAREKGMTFIANINL